jgi:hypothetical protein
MSICPFLSGSIATVFNEDNIPTKFEVVHAQCVESECQIWDAVNNRCGMQITDTIRNPENETGTLISMLETVVGKGSERDSNHSLVSYLQDVVGVHSEKDEDRSLIEFLQKIVGVNAEKDVGQSLMVFLQNMIGSSDEKDAAEGTGSSLIKVANHIHGAHWHSIGHECSEIPAECGSFLFGSSAPYAAKLINEYMAYEDLDGNGLIYGRDFKVKSSNDKPPMLLSIEDSPIWVNPEIEVSWVELRKWSENPNENINPLEGCMPASMDESGDPEGSK